VKLFEPVHIGTMRLDNRVVLPAMVTRLSGEDGFVNDAVRDRYLRFARGEPGLIVIEAMAVHDARSGPLLRLSDDEFLAGHHDLAARLHDAGPARVVPQIIHFLKVARSGWRQKVEDLPRAEIGGIVEAYGRAAERARRAGYDGVELHMAHAYTLSSFLSRRNARRDEYGGSLDNRMRLPSEVIERVRAAVGADFPIGVRFDGEECIKDGYGLLDAREFALRMARLSVDYVSISAGGKFEDAIHKPGQPLYPYTGYSGDRCMPPASYQDGYNSYLSAGIRAHLRAHGFSTPVCATGKIGTSALAQRVLDDGTADLVGMARAMLCDPDLPKKWREGREHMVIRCTYGNVCKALDENFRTVRCVYYPRGALHAPVSDDTTPPVWTSPRRLFAAFAFGRVELSWPAATDNEGVYGYEIFRAEGDAALSHLTSVHGHKHEWSDPTVAGGTRYRYAVRAYDYAGNRSPPTDEAVVEVPMGTTPPPPAGPANADERPAR
jgi:2,4-dienoyl-CoA reductase-like NADH-dependent reductase (Old Yellow Enzyme family)